MNAASRLLAQIGDFFKVTPMDMEAVAASQTAQICGSRGAIGDYLDHVVIVVATAATAQTSIVDGSTGIVIFPNSPGGGIGVYDVPIRACSTTGGWSITTGAGASAIAVGIFS
jgi:hypothetical protein